MHRVLLIDEILRGVFEHIDGDVDVDRQPVRYTFASLARVCQAWRDPALDFLWRFQHSTDPLFSLIPGAVLKENTTVRPRSLFSLAIFLSSSWHPFDVRHSPLMVTYPPNPSPSSSPTRPAFAQLRTTPAHSPSSPLLFSPSSGRTTRSTPSSPPSPPSASFSEMPRGGTSRRRSTFPGASATSPSTSAS